MSAQDEILVSEPVRIAWCITDLDQGGAERALVQIVTRLDRRLFAPKVFCLSKRGLLADELERQQIPVESLDARNRRDVGLLGRLTRALRDWRPELLQTFLYHANILGRIAAWRAGIPHVVSGIRVADQRSVWRLRIDRWTDRLVDQHVCVSQAVAEFSIRSGLPKDKVIVIPNGVDAERIALAAPADVSKLGVPPGSRVVISVGRLDRQKGMTTLVEAFAQLSTEFSAAHLMIVGEGPQRNELTAQIERLELQDRVHLVGWRDDVPGLLKSADCFALASLWEGMPNVVLEAMAAALPVVVTRVEGIQELVQHDQTGWVVDPQNPQELAAVLREVFTDSGKARAVGLSGQHLVAEQFTWNAASRKYSELYRGLLKCAANGASEQ